MIPEVGTSRWKVGPRLFLQIWRHERQDRPRGTAQRWMEASLATYLACVELSEFAKPRYASDVEPKQ